MPSNPTFPGVYIEEVPNGARTITGVATSVTAFVGHASHGPLNQAIHLLSFADFERHFGGLDAKSELSYAVRQFFINGGTEAWVVRLAKNAIAAAQADTSNSQTADVTLAGGHEEPYPAKEAYHLFIADRSARQGIFALEAVDLFNLLVLPGVTDPAILLDSSTYCQERRAFLIEDAPPSAQTPDQMVQAITGTALPKTSYAAVYFPWIKIADPLNGGLLRSVAPSGTIAGLYARNDSAQGVWKAPAGTEATLAGVQTLDYPLTDSESAALNPLGVNCIRLFPVFGPVAWGARTLQGDDQTAGDWKYIPVRRVALFLEESFYRGTKWAVFEPNAEPLWAQIRLSIGAFMQNLFLQGAFQGQTPSDAYFVKCDKDTTTQNDINLGIVNIIVGFAPLKPAEFVIINIQQMAGQIAA
jgi:phage tail sheath protein FI